MKVSLRIRPRKLLRRLEVVYVIVALLLLSRAFRFLLGGSEDGAMATAVLIAVFAVSLPVVAWRIKHFVWVALRDKLLLVVVGFVLVSILWSTAPEISLRRGIVLLGATYFGIYLATSFDLKTFIRLLAWTFLIAAVMSVALAFLVPELGVGSGRITNAWTGIYDQKNVLGRVMTVAALTFWHVARHERGRMRWLWWGGFATAVALILLSRSATSLVILVLALALYPAYRALRWRDQRLVVGILALAVLIGSVVAFIFAADTDLFFTTLGRDPDGNTFLGRLLLWGDLWFLLQPVLLQGYGYNAFWRGFDGPSADIWAKYRWKPGHAHNGYLDLWLDLGLVGLLLIVSHLVASLVRVVRLIRLNGAPEAFWALSYLVFLVVANATYSLLVSQSVFFWTIYVAAVLGVGVELARARAQRVPTTAVAPADSHPLPA